MSSPGFTTTAIHQTGSEPDAHRALQFPIYAGVAFDFKTAETMAETFSGRRGAYSYSRIANPTVEAFERKMTALEGGLATVAVSSGMAAISTALLNLLGAGDNIVASSSLFGGSHSLLEKVLQPLGIEVRYVNIQDLDAVESAIDGQTRVLFLETISNPCALVPDFSGIAAIARRHQVVVLADSTVTTPYLFKAGRFGVNIVLHSTTKYISGGATSLGGAIVDLGNFDWKVVPALKDYHRFNEMAFIARLRREVHRETGACLSPHDAYLQSLGLETLALRMDRVCQNAQAVAEFLDDEDAVRCVNYPGLPTSPFHDLADRQFNGKGGGVLSFELRDTATSFRFLNRLALVRRASNIGDNKTLALHPASTLYAGFDALRLNAIGIHAGLIRLSLGIEDTRDIIADLRQALKEVV